MSLAVRVLPRDTDFGAAFIKVEVKTKEYVATVKTMYCITDKFYLN